jgi:hypothetical protein
MLKKEVIRMRADRRISLRLFVLLLFSGALMGWMVLVVAAYYLVRSDDQQWVQRNIEVLSNISPAAGNSGQNQPEPSASTGGAATKASGR